jgi:xylulokinase
MYLGIDLGTSELKTCLVDEAQQVIGSTAARLEISRPKPLWSEQAPQAWVLAMHQAMDALRARHAQALAAVRAVAVSGQMHGAVLLDARREVLRPAILWNDTRAHAECAELEALVPAAHEITGNLVMPGFTAPKLAWLRRHDPGLSAQVRTVMLPKDYLTLHLSGELCTEMSDAAGTAWLDVAKRDWSDTMLAATGLAREHMPRLLEGAQPAGELRRELRERWGIAAASVVVAAGAGDNAAAGLGAGAVGSGRATVSLGSSGVIFVAADRHAANPAQAVHAFCHALPQRWIQMSVMLSATTSLGWAASLCRAKGDAAFAAQAESVEIERAPIFLPYLNGERTPHNDAGAKGQLFGLTSSTDAAALAYAVMEGVAFGLADGHAALAAAGTVVDAAVALGGGSNSAFWLQLVAAATGMRLKKPAESDKGGAFGAARLAMLASGAGTPESICLAPEAAAEIVADATLRQRLAPRLERYRRLYERTRDLTGAA